jgi:hypothetical protein
MSKLNRRDILKLGALGTAAGLGFPAIIRAQPKEIVMLGIWPNTGAFSDVGPILDRGMKMALEERADPRSRHEDGARGAQHERARPADQVHRARLGDASRDSDPTR